jgi:hypothetical protein
MPRGVAVSLVSESHISPQLRNTLVWAEVLGFKALRGQPDTMTPLQLLVACLLVPRCSILLPSCHDQTCDADGSDPASRGHFKD